MIHITGNEILALIKESALHENGVTRPRHLKVKYDFQSYIVKIVFLNAGYISKLIESFRIIKDISIRFLLKMEGAYARG